MWQHGHHPFLFMKIAFVYSLCDNVKILRELLPLKYEQMNTSAAFKSSVVKQILYLQ